MPAWSQAGKCELQWVHGLVTVVMWRVLRDDGIAWVLQWVHGLVTVVMGLPCCTSAVSDGASMGPRSGNRGYGHKLLASIAKTLALQWVHGLVTVVMVGRQLLLTLVPLASMG